MKSDDIYAADYIARGMPVDKCALYCYRLAVYYADHGGKLPEGNKTGGTGRIDNEKFNAAGQRQYCEIRQNYNEIAALCKSYGEPVFLTKNREGDLAEYLASVTADDNVRKTVVAAETVLFTVLAY